MPTTDPIRMAKTLGDQTAVMTLLPTDDATIAQTTTINGRLVHEDVAEFGSMADRDATLAEVVADLTRAGYYQI